jgi:hypothetical protein
MEKARQSVAVKPRPVRGILPATGRSTLRSPFQLGEVPGLLE